MSGFIATSSATHAHAKRSLQINAIEELGDICWYIALAIDALHLDLELLRNETMIYKFHPELPDKLLIDAIAVIGLKASMLDDLAVNPLTDAAIANVHEEANMRDARRYKFTSHFAHILSCVIVCAEILGVSFEDVLEANIAKLRVRYPDKFVAEYEAVDRHGIGERE